MDLEKKGLILPAFNWLRQRKFPVFPLSRQTFFYTHLQPTTSSTQHPTAAQADPVHEPSDGHCQSWEEQPQLLK